MGKLLKVDCTNDLVGRCVDDFVPSGMVGYHKYLFSSQVLNSGSSTIAFHTVLKRPNGSHFQCIVGLSFLKNYRDNMVEKVCTVYLNSVRGIGCVWYW